jgi:tetratricopeptide (TPR) repeat protein
VLGIAAAVAASGVVAATVLRSGGEPQVAGPSTTAKRAVVVIPRFTNTTGDPRLDDALDPEVADVIYRSTRFDPMAGLDLIHAVKSTGVEPDGLAAKMPGRKVIVVHGSVARDGDGFAVTLDGQTRRTAKVDGLLGATGDLARDLRRRLGDDAISEDLPVASSVEAVHEYAQANLLAMAGDLKGAAVGLDRALALDPHFVGARISLGLVLYNLSEQKRATAAMEAAVADADRLPERLRLQLLGDYYGTIGKNPEAISAYQRYLARWPGDQRTEINLIATAIDAGDFALAYELAKHTVVEHPDLGVVRANFVLAELATGRAQEAATDGVRMLDEIARPSDYGFAFVAMAQSLIGRGADATKTWGRLAMHNPELAAQGMADQAIYEGRLDAALALVDPYIEIALLMKSPRDARPELLKRAEIRLQRGDRDGAAADAAWVMDLGEPRPDYTAASITVAAGHLDGQDARARAWQGNDLLEWRTFGKLLEGDLALARAKPDAAVAAYREAVRTLPLWIAHARLLHGYIGAKAWPDAQRELDWCQEHRGEATVFMTPTLAYLLELEAARKAILVK